MVGRTPEYIGKKIEQKEVKMAMLAPDRHRLQHPRLHGDQRRDPVPRKAATGTPPGAAIANLNNAGPHGFS